MPPLKIAVLSDLHFFLKDEASAEAHSHLPVGPDGELVANSQGPNKNPVDDLKQLIVDKGLAADILLCPGDITTRADSTALGLGWRCLNELAAQLGATLLCAATGNHDVESRSQQKKVQTNVIRGLSQVTGPIEALKLLRPLYPAVRLDSHCPAGDHRRGQGKYFGESFFLIDHDPRYRVLTFNSCADHGHDSHEFERGTAPGSALCWVEEDLSTLNERKINIMVAHHPLISQSTHDGDKYGFQAGGDHLLKLAENLADDWLVINGHKHHGELKLGPSTTGVHMTLFSAASFSVVMPPGSEGSENQFYLVEIDRSPASSLVGNFRTWNWYVGRKWVRAAPGSKTGIYDDCGFGSILTPRQIAEQINAQFQAGVTSWTELRSVMPELGHVMPDAMRSTRAILDREHQLIIETDEMGFYVAISRKAN